MNTSPSNENPHFLVRLFRAFTDCITHPYVAWTLFLFLTVFHLTVTRGFPGIFKAESELTMDRVHFHTRLADHQADIKELLENARAATEDCR